MQAILKVECPYCGRKQRFLRELRPETKSEVVFCECEEGGCDRPFAVFFRADFVVSRVARLADEGDGESGEAPAPAPAPAPVSEFLAEDVAEARALLAQFEELAGATDGEHSPLDLLPEDARRTLSSLACRLERAANGVAGRPVAVLPSASPLGVLESDPFFLLDPIANARRSSRAAYVA